MLFKVCVKALLYISKVQLRGFKGRVQDAMFD